MIRKLHARNLLPFALSGVFLKALLTLGCNPLLLENLDFLGKVSINRAEKVFVQDAFGRFKCLRERTRNVIVGPVGASSFLYGVDLLIETLAEHKQTREIE